MPKKPFSFKFFYQTLGYHKIVKGGFPFYTKKVGRNRFSTLSAEAFREEYEEVCARLQASKKEDEVKDAK